MCDTKKSNLIILAAHFKKNPGEEQVFSS